jgi:hypothetical protein
VLSGWLAVAGCRLPLWFSPDWVVGTFVGVCAGRMPDTVNNRSAAQRMSIECALDFLIPCFPVVFKQITTMRSYHDVGERDAETVLLMPLEVLRDVTLERTFTMDTRS